MQKENGTNNFKNCVPILGKNVHYSSSMKDSIVVTGKG